MTPTPDMPTAEYQAVADDWTRTLSNTRLAANLATLLDDPHYLSDRERVAVIKEAARRLMS